MKLAGLKELLALSEAKRDIDGEALLYGWMEANRATRFEGSTGVRNLENLVRTLGYNDINDFLTDNSGAIEAIIEFIKSWVDRNEEWANALAIEESVDTKAQ
jgi:hypothetical protein